MRLEGVKNRWVMLIKWFVVPKVELQKDEEFQVVLKQLTHHEEQPDMLYGVFILFYCSPLLDM